MNSLKCERAPFVSYFYTILAYMVSCINVSWCWQLFGWSHDTRSDVDKYVESSEGAFPASSGARYVLGNSLSEGGFANTRWCHHIGRDDDERLIAKVFVERTMCENERKAIQRLNRHSNIIQMVDCSIDDKTLILEYGGETLIDWINDNKPYDPWGVATQLLRAVEYMHVMGVYHRDIKLENATITPEGVVKLIDFNLAIMGMTQKIRDGKRIGSLMYASPQVLERSHYRADKADAWSLGVCIFAVYFRCFPMSAAILEDSTFLAFYMLQMSNVKWMAFARSHFLSSFPLHRVAERIVDSLLVVSESTRSSPMDVARMIVV